MSPISNAAEAVKLQPFHLFGIYLNSAKVEKFSKISGIGLKGVPHVRLNDSLAR